jgi:hypothetical protein
MYSLANGSKPNQIILSDAEDQRVVDSEERNNYTFLSLSHQKTKRMKSELNYLI